jgi:hypothetical protein
LLHIKLPDALHLQALKAKSIIIRGCRWNSGAHNLLHDLFHSISQNSVTPFLHGFLTLLQHTKIQKA